MVDRNTIQRGQIASILLVTFTRLTTHTRTCTHAHTHTHTHTHPFNGPLSGTTRVSYQKGKTNLDLLKQETVSGSGIRWAICKSAPRSSQITMPVPHHSSFFTGRMPFLSPNQQCQGTEGNRLTTSFVTIMNGKFKTAQ